MWLEYRALKPYCQALFRALTPYSRCDLIQSMDLNTLRLKLAAVNLTRLAKTTGINVRTLRRIKSGQTSDVMLATMETLERALTRGKGKS